MLQLNTFFSYIIIRKFSPRKRDIAKSLYTGSWRQVPLMKPLKFCYNIIRPVTSDLTKNLPHLLRHLIMHWLLLFGRSQWPFACKDCEYESRRRHEYLSVIEGCVLSSGGLWVGPINRPEDSYRVCCVCDLKTSATGTPRPTGSVQLFKQIVLWVKSQFITVQLHRCFFYREWWQGADYEGFLASKFHFSLAVTNHTHNQSPNYKFQ
jgi:hypothetical protein